MDFLDPQNQKRHQISLFVGYAFVSIMIVLTSWLLFNQAGGFGLDKNGNVVQSGLLFVSSQPAGADIRLNGALNPKKTNTRLSILNGQYNLQLSRSGYRDWQQAISVYGGSVQHYDYPFLFPQKLVTTSIHPTYTQAPVLATQSPDQRWLVVQPTTAPNFELFDLKATKPTVSTLSLPADVPSAGTDQSWKVAQWSSDNRHLLLEHGYDSKTEFITLDRTTPEASINISKLVGDEAAKISYQNDKFDHFFLYNAATQVLSTANVGNPQAVTLLDHVLTYKTYGNDMVFYVSSQTVTSGKVAITVLQSGQKYLLREIPTSESGFVLDFTQYSGVWYMAVGSSSDNRVYIYKDPVGQLRSKNSSAIASYVLKTPSPTYVGFSPNSQFIIDENGSQFAVYDIENDKAYAFSTNHVLDAPQPHAVWMDGYHLAYVSGGKLLVSDFDGSNLQSLMPASSAYDPFFAANYKTVTALAPATAGGTALQTTALRTPVDQ